MSVPLSNWSSFAGVLTLSDHRSSSIGSPATHQFVGFSLIPMAPSFTPDLPYISQRTAALHGRITFSVYQIPGYFFARCSSISSLRRRGLGPPQRAPSPVPRAKVCKHMFTTFRTGRSPIDPSLLIRRRFSPIPAIRKTSIQVSPARFRHMYQCRRRT